MISTKLPTPIREARVPKLVFITIPCLKFWAQEYTGFKVNISRVEYTVKVYHGIPGYTRVHQEYNISRVQDIRILGSTRGSMYLGVDIKYLSFLGVQYI